MDKWDEIVHRIQQGILAEEPEAALTAGGFSFSPNSAARSK
jgi:hypothetical protein